MLDRNVYRDIAVRSLNDKNPYHLSSDAGCATPDTLTSDGAAMLSRVRDGVVELIEALDVDDWHGAADTIDIGSLNDDGAVSEIADGAPSVYTAEVWRQFTDLAAYNEDPTEFGPIEDMDKAAGICLYMIADRLAGVLLEEAAEIYRDALADLEEFEDA